MLIETAIINELLATEAATDLVGERVYQVMAPQDVAKPYIIIAKIDGPRISSQDGPAGLASPRFQISIFATRYAEAKEIAAAVQAALDGFSGVMGGAGGVQVGGIFYEDENDLYEEGTELYQVACDYIIWHQE